VARWRQPGLNIRPRGTSNDAGKHNFHVKPNRFSRLTNAGPASTVVARWAMCDERFATLIAGQSKSPGIHALLRPQL